YREGVSKRTGYRARWIKVRCDREGPASTTCRRLTTAHQPREARGGRDVRTVGDGERPSSVPAQTDPVQQGPEQREQPKRDQSRGGHRQRTAVQRYGLR